MSARAVGKLALDRSEVTEARRMARTVGRPIVRAPDQLPHLMHDPIKANRNAI